MRPFGRVFLLLSFFLTVIGAHSFVVYHAKPLFKSEIVRVEPRKLPAYFPTLVCLDNNGDPREVKLYPSWKRDFKEKRELELIHLYGSLKPRKFFASSEIAFWLTMLIPMGLLLWGLDRNRASQRLTEN